jgi:hypothetical protein
MSDNFVIFLPRDPEFVPELSARQAAEALLRQLAPSAGEISCTVSEAVRFIDPGGNFESVTCPNCGADLGDWWPEAMDAAYDGSGFPSLVTTLPCCRAKCSLNDLVYEWPAAFARFELSAQNPGVELTLEQLGELEAALGCALVRIRAHY